MKKYLIVLIACGMFAACTSTTPGKELLTINGKTITEGDLEFLGTVNPRIRAQLNNPMGRKQIIDNIIEQELFYQASAKKGLDHDPQVKAKADLYRRVIVAQAYVEKQLEAQAMTFYKEHQSDFEKLRMSHILIKTKPAAALSNPLVKGAKAPAAEGHSDAEALALAQAAKARLDQKEDFATVAKAVSEDAITKASGGELGEVAKNEPRLARRGYEPLVEKAFSMTVGEVSAPIKLEDGYHIIVVTRGIEVEPFESAKQGIMFRQQGDIRNKLLTDLKQQAKISYADASLKPDETAPAPAESGAPEAPTGPATPGAPAADGNGHSHGPGDGHDHGPAPTPPKK